MTAVGAIRFDVMVLVRTCIQSVCRYTQPAFEENVSWPKTQTAGGTWVYYQARKEGRGCSKGASPKSPRASLNILTQYY